jgi:hypothetical protein
MTRAFIVTLELSDADVQYLGGIAEAVQESLETDGMIVISVAPFAAPEASTEQQSSIGSLSLAVPEAPKPLGLF